MKGLGSAMAETTRFTRKDGVLDARDAAAHRAVRAGFERDVERAAHRLAPARAKAWASPWGRPPGCVRPRATTTGPSGVSCVTMAPTEGLGQVAPRWRAP